MNSPRTVTSQWRDYLFRVPACLCVRARGEVSRGEGAARLCVHARGEVSRGEVSRGEVSQGEGEIAPCWRLAD